MVGFGTTIFQDPLQLIIDPYLLSGNFFIDRRKIPIDSSFVLLAGTDDFNLFLYDQMTVFMDFDMTMKIEDPLTLTGQAVARPHQNQSEQNRKAEPFASI